MNHSKAVALSLVLGFLSSAAAAEIKVSPGKGALAAGLGKAKPGDVVHVAAGEYAESVTVGEGVTVEGAGADKTTIVSNEFAAINCAGPRVRIIGFTIRGGKGCERAVNTSAPLRVERCRFEKMATGVALMGAPLSDIIACEFHDCGIGVRAIGGACPTVWGCAFIAGKMGVIGMNGSPYIRNNLFDGVDSAIRLSPGDADGSIIRNNVFHKCKTTAIEVFEPKPAFSAPSIRNSIFVRCGAALIASKKLANSTSHAVLHEVKSPAFRDADGGETIKVGQAGLSETAVSLTIEKDLTVKAGPAESLIDKGIGPWSDKKIVPGTIGLDKAWSRVGVGATAKLPPQRWGGKLLIANSVSEEYLYVKSIGRKSGKQGLTHENGKPMDRLTLEGDEDPKEIVFDLSRFFGEAFIK
jgi:hypothetical protein